ncbi:TetR/AcrR family transcriptional regulator [Arthrobacter globiformis]|uniref:TetR/AcrR family transcriptional regulator n=1 Tax=Arthrobacter globiformis TaxID=1665 RepID=A0A328HL80_ARTGO|nr:TetR/AcrR family transcriptional regulator [Arthrobacter globiformis]RAM38961.1 TetR/AcrR family transcriptional regulator [Arthrobacter globiformis]
MPATSHAGGEIRTPRERARAQTIADIIGLGRRHLAERGAAALSLRAVARDLGVVSSAVYRYVGSRDELLTLLLVDAYNDLGDAVDAAVKAVPAEEFRGRFAALARAVRGWALREPARYGLLFGSPVPGYQAPAERTTAPGTRVVISLVQILDAAHRAARLAGRGPSAVPAPLAADLEAIRRELGVEVPDALLARGTLVWASLFGAVSFEVFGQYGAGTFSAPDELFEHHIAVLADLAGL